MNKEICFFSKKNDAFDSALIASREHSYIPYDGMDIFSQEGQATPSLHLYGDQNQETYLIKKDLFNSLSNDAHFIINAIDNRLPIIATPKTGNITKKSIELFLTKKHWSKHKIHKVLVEIQGFVMEMSEL